MPSEIENLQYESSYSTIDLKWNPPLQPNGIINKYEVRYKVNFVKKSFKTTKADFKALRRESRLYCWSHTFMQHFQIIFLVPLQIGMQP